MADQSIDRGAELIALADLAGNRETEIIRAAQQMGLSEQDTVRMIQRALRRDSDLRSDPNGINLILDNIVKQAGEIEAINNKAPGEIPGFRSVSNSVVQDGEFGNQDELQNFGGLDTDGRIKDVDQAISEQSKVRGKKDSNQLRRTFFDKATRELQSEELYVPDGQPTPRRFRESAKSGDFGIFGENQVAPAQQVLGEEYARIQQRVNDSGYDANPGAAQLLGDIELELNGNEVRKAERDISRRLVAQDREGLVKEEIDRRVNVQLNDEFGGESTFGTARSMPINAYEDRRAELSAQIGAIRQNAEAVEANNWRAQAEANILGRDFQVDGRGYLADEAVAGIGDISSLGTAKSGEYATRAFVDRGPANPNSLDIGIPGAYEGSGSAGRSQGPLLAQQQWLKDNMGGITYEVVGGGVGGAGEIAIDQAVNGAMSESGLGNYRDLPVGPQLAKLQAGIEGITVGGTKKRGRTPARPGVPVDLNGLQIRNLDQLQQAVDLVISAKRTAGENFWRKDGNVNRPVSNPGINEVLQLARINAGDTTNIANVLYQIEAANRDTRNQGAKEAFRDNIDLDRNRDMSGRRLVRVDDGESGFDYRVVRAPGEKVEGGGFHKKLGNGNAGVARLGANEKVTMESGERKNVKALFQSADGFAGGPDRNEAPLNQDELAQVRMPFIGAAEPEGAAKPAWLSAEGAQLTPDERVAAYGPANAAIANNIEQRALSARAAREAALVPQQETVASLMRQKDEQFADDTVTRDVADNRRALLQAAEDQGKSLVGKGQMLLGPRKGAQQIVPGGMTGRNLVPDNVGGRVAPAAQAIRAFEPQAPDPWRQQPATGPGFSEVRTPSMSARPQAALPYGVQTSGASQDVTRPLTNELRNELAALSSGYAEQGPRPESNFSDPGIQADGPSPIGLRRRNGAADARLARRQVSRYGRGAAITGGVGAAIAGLDGLIGGERNRRNEEEQYS